MVDGDGAMLSSNVVASQTDLHARFGGVVPEIASRRHLELVAPVDPRGARRRPASALDDVERVAVTHGPGLIGALLVGLSAAKALAWASGMPLVPVDHLHGHVASLYLAARPARAAVHAACSRRRPHAAPRRARPRRASTCSARRSTTRRARRSTRARGCSASATPAAPRSTGSRGEGDPEAFALPGRARARPRLLVLGPQDGAALRGARPRRGELDARRADLAASLPARDRPRARRAAARRRRGGGRRAIAVVGGVAANSELRAALPEARVRPATALHGQRGDDRLRRPLRRPPRGRRLPRAGCLCVGLGTRSPRWRSSAWLALGGRCRRGRRDTRRAPPGIGRGSSAAALRPSSAAGGVVVLRGALGRRPRPPGGEHSGGAADARVDPPRRRGATTGDRRALGHVAPR